MNSHHRRGGIFIRSTLLVLLAASIFSGRLDAATACEAEVPDGAMPDSVQSGQNGLLRANEMAERRQFKDALQALKEIKWRPNVDIAASGAGDEQRYLATEIRFALAGAYFRVDRQYCRSARQLGEVLASGHLPDGLIADVEAVLKAWGKSHLNLAEMLQTLPVLVRLIDERLGRVPAQQLLRGLTTAWLHDPALRDARRQVQELVIELYATGYWPVDDFLSLEAPRIADLMDRMQSLPHQDRRIWGDVCTAYGLSRDCRHTQEFPAVANPKDARQLFPAIAVGIPPVYNTGPSLKSVFKPEFGARHNAPSRVRLFTVLLSQVARDLYAGKSPGRVEQALNRWKAAVFLDPGDVVSAEYAVSLIVDNGRDQDLSFRTWLVRGLELTRANEPSLFARLRPNSASSSVVAAGDVEAGLTIFSLLISDLMTRELASFDNRPATDLLARSSKQLTTLAKVVLTQKTVSPEVLRKAARALAPAKKEQCSAPQNVAACDLAGKLLDRAYGQLLIVKDNEGANRVAAEWQERLPGAVSVPIGDSTPGEFGIATPYEGDQLVQGTLPYEHPTLLKVTAGNAEDCKTHVQGELPLWDRDQTAVRYVDSNQRQYLIPLQLPLQRKQCVQVSYPKGSDLVRRTGIVEPGTRGWGRQRLYGRIGYEFFPPSEAHDTTSAFFGSLTYDFAFRAETISPEFRPKSKWPGIHGYLEGRLESMSVSVKVGLPEGQLNQEICGRRSTCPGAPHAGQAGEVGLYTPWIVPRTSFFYRGSAVGLFVAPLIKVGTQGRHGLESSQSKQIPVIIDGRTLLGDELREGPFSYRAAGLRVGQFRYFSSRNGTCCILGQTAPVLLWNLDYTVGHWQSFTLPPYQNFTTIPWRSELRLNFSVSPLPFFFAYFRNSGPGPTDWRVFVGLRYEFAQLRERIRRSHLNR